MAEVGGGVELSAAAEPLSAHAQLAQAERDITEQLDILIDEHRKQLGASAESTAPAQAAPSELSPDATRRFRFPPQSSLPAAGGIGGISSSGTDWTAIAVLADADTALAGARAEMRTALAARVAAIRRQRHESELAERQRLDAYSAEVAAALERAATCPAPPAHSSLRSPSRALEAAEPPPGPARLAAEICSLASELRALDPFCAPQLRGVGASTAAALLALPSNLLTLRMNRNLLLDLDAPPARAARARGAGAVSNRLLQRATAYGGLLDAACRLLFRARRAHDLLRPLGAPPLTLVELLAAVAPHAQREPPSAATGPAGRRARASDGGDEREPARARPAMRPPQLGLSGRAPLSAGQPRRPTYGEVRLQLAQLGSAWERSRLDQLELPQLVDASAELREYVYCWIERGQPPLDAHAHAEPIPADVRPPSGDASAAPPAAPRPPAPPALGAAAHRTLLELASHAHGLEPAGALGVAAAARARHGLHGGAERPTHARHAAAGAGATGGGEARPRLHVASAPVLLPPVPAASAPPQHAAVDEPVPAQLLDSASALSAAEPSAAERLLLPSYELERERAQLLLDERGARPLASRALFAYSARTADEPASDVDGLWEQLSSQLFDSIGSALAAGELGGGGRRDAHGNSRSAHGGGYGGFFEPPPSVTSVAPPAAPGARAVLGASRSSSQLGGSMPAHAAARRGVGRKAIRLAQLLPPPTSAAMVRGSVPARSQPWP